MSSEQRTARETLEQAFHEMADEWIRQADDIRLRRGQMTREKRGHEMLASCAYAIQDKIAALRAAPAPEPEHVCGGCGYKWNWPVPSPIELCGDCWRKTWQILRGAAPAPEGETPKRECSLCGFSLALCLEAKLHGEACCPHCFHPPASPGPTPE
jgi:hypothetical protein